MKNSQKGFALLTVLLIAVGVLIAGGAGYWYYQSQNEAPELIGGQKDEHGCLGPAGYSWCEVKQKCLRVWEEKCELATSTAQSSCVDSDGGKNIYVKGAAKLFDSKTTIYVGEDSCATPYDGPAKYTTGLPSCSGNNCYVNENYCGNYQGGLIPQHEFIQCPHGCADGACIK